LCIAEEALLESLAAFEEAVSESLVRPEEAR
jgi:hypothetical protein